MGRASKTAPHGKRGGEVPHDGPPPHEPLRRRSASPDRGRAHPPPTTTVKEHSLAVTTKVTLVRHSSSDHRIHTRGSREKLRREASSPPREKLRHEASPPPPREKLRREASSPPREKLRHEASLPPREKLRHEAPVPPLPIKKAAVKSATVHPAVLPQTTRLNSSHVKPRNERHTRNSRPSEMSFWGFVEASILFLFCALDVYLCWYALSFVADKISITRPAPKGY